MSLLDLASLVLAPTATKEGKVYSAIPDTGDGDMTFTRGSAATRVNSAGLIEKERGNLLLQSNTFSTSPWESNQANREAVVSSGEQGYDGTNDAWLVVDTTGSGLHQITGENLTLSGINTSSVYAKAYSNSRYLGMAGFGLAGGNEMPVFDLENGTIDMPSTSSILKDAKIESVGDGWYRCSMTFLFSGTSSFSITLCDSATDNSLSGYTYTGTGSNGFYIQDAMLNQGLVATDYIETTTSAVYEGITDDVPRVDYSGGGCPSLLLEPQRTNKITQSEYFESGWSDNGYISYDFGYLAPDGTNSAYKITGNDNGYISFSGVLNNDTRSVFARTTSGTGTLQLLTYFGNTNNTFTITEEWQRFNISSVTTSTGESNFYLVDFRGSTSLDEVILWGAQCEAGSYPTSYIPTYGVSSTRVADTCYKTGISELIGQTEGTLFGEFNIDHISNGVILSIGDGTANNRFVIQFTNATTLYCTVRIAGVNLDYSVTIPEIASNGGVFKVALGYKTDDYVFALNGVIYSPSTASRGVPACSVLYMGMSTFSANQIEGGINQAILFPTRLTNDQLEELTK